MELKSEMCMQNAKHRIQKTGPHKASQIKKKVHEKWDRFW